MDKRYPCVGTVSSSTAPISGHNRRSKGSLGHQRLNTRINRSFGVERSTRAGAQ